MSAGVKLFFYLMDVKWFCQSERYITEHRAFPFY